MCAVRFCETNKEERAGVADYRFSANVISRSKGQSSIASAAYRSAERLIDERTGEIHDYTRKGGVILSTVIAPEGTPDWMHDRAQLWNAVEAVERRKDAQLSREIQLSLPHELTDDQRQALVVGFVQEQFAARGMVADLAIHAPNAEGDLRNHHAHVMLTMRTLTGDGFGNKARDWNSPDQLAEWREQWAHHQNRELERHGHPARVDHRSFEAQGVDREPTQHLGPVANDMERNGKDSRIGNENRAIRTTNYDRVADQVELSQVLSAVDFQKSKLDRWSDHKRTELDNAQDLSKLDFAQKQERQQAQLEAKLGQIYGTAKAAVKVELQSVEKRLEAKGIKKALRTIFGKNRTDQVARNELSATLTGIEGREQEQRQALERRQDADRRKEGRRMSQNKDRLEKGIRTAKERREAEGWKPTSPRGTKRTGRPDRAKQPKPVQTPAPSPTKPESATTTPIKGRFGAEAQPPEVKPSDAPTLADEKRAIGHVLDEFKGDAKRPWQRASLSNENERPWQRSDKPAGRERSPSDKPKDPKA